MPSRSVAGSEPVAAGVDLLLDHAVRQQGANQTVDGGGGQVDGGRDLAQTHAPAALQHREDAQSAIHGLDHPSTFLPPNPPLC